MDLKSVHLMGLACLCALVLSVEGTIDCYTCSSKNGTDPSCEDPMSPANQPLEMNCMVPKENHIGKFPANFCVKMIGKSVNSGGTLVIRTCVLEDMNSQCGTFRFQNDTLKGCILTCKYDGCNTAATTNTSNSVIMVMALVVMYYYPT